MLVLVGVKTELVAWLALHHRAENRINQDPSVGWQRCGSRDTLRRRNLITGYFKEEIRLFSPQSRAGLQNNLQRESFNSRRFKLITRICKERVGEGDNVIREIKLGTVKRHLTDIRQR